MDKPKTKKTTHSNLCPVSSLSSVPLHGFELVFRFFVLAGLPKTMDKKTNSSDLCNLSSLSSAMGLIYFLWFFVFFVCFVFSRFLFDPGIVLVDST